MLGYSVYFSQLDMKFIEKMDAADIKTIFTSLHIPEEQIDRQAIGDFLVRSSAQGRDIVIDISPHTLQVTGEAAYTELSGLGVKTVRVDFGFAAEEMVALQRQFRIVLNASTLNEQTICRLQAQGLVLKDVIAMHNFYPREHTGLSRAFFQSQNNMLASYGIGVWAFIPGDQVRRGPMFAGLPTLEAHRGQSPYISFVELAQQSNIDGVFIGDCQLAADTLTMIMDVINTKVITLPVEHLNAHIARNVIYNSRADEAQDVIRLEEGRAMLAAKAALYHETQPGVRGVGAITVDNAAYLRYQGELQIVKTVLPADARVNIAGRLQPAYFGLLPYIKAGAKLKFQ